jgi:Flp pilus assembly protein TadD
MPDVPVNKMPVANHPDMMMLVPNAPLNAGLYSISIGSQPDYQFGVSTPNEEDFWNTVLAKRSDCWQAHNHLGGLLYMRGDINGAYFHFAKAVEINPQNCESNNNLGLALSELGKKEEAIHEFEIAVKLQDDTAIETNLANTYLEVKKYDDAIRAYRNAIQLCPQNASAHCNLGWVLMRQGKVDDAIVEFRRTVELDPNMAQGKSDLEQALRVKGNKR